MYIKKYCTQHSLWGSLAKNGKPKSNNALISTLQVTWESEEHVKNTLGIQTAKSRIWEILQDLCFQPLSLTLLTKSSSFLTALAHNHLSFSSYFYLTWSFSHSPLVLYILSKPEINNTDRGPALALYELEAAEALKISQP